MRRHVWIDRPADTVWNLVCDPGGVARWFPGMTDVKVDGSHRVITLESGLPLDEDVVTVRHDLRRFQYRLNGPLPVEYHLATIDVIEDGAGRCLVTYSTEVVPAALAFVLDGAVGDALENLKRVMEAA